MRTLIIITLALAVAAGCTRYASVARTNAPGVVDISTPPVRENGSDDLYELPASDKPGTRSIVAWLHPAFGGGLVRHGAGYELSVGVSIERDTSSASGTPIANRAWGVSLGMGLVQFRDPPGEGTVTEAPGPLSVEAYHRRFIVMFAAGPVIYPDTRDAGAQVTIHAPLSQLRFRYVQNTGFEVMVAFDFNFPVVFGWSR